MDVMPTAGGSFMPCSVVPLILQRPFQAGFDTLCYDLPEFVFFGVQFIADLQAFLYRVYIENEGERNSVENGRNMENRWTTCCCRKILLGPKAAALLPRRCTEVAAEPGPLHLSPARLHSLEHFSKIAPCVENDLMLYFRR